MSYSFDAVSYTNTGKRLKNYQCGDVSVTKNSDGSITFSANGGQSSVTLSADEVRGRGIKKVEINSNNHLICTLDDDTTIDAGVLPSGTTNYTDLTNKPSIGGVELNGDKSLNDLGITNYNDTQVKKDIADLKSDKQDKTDNSLDTTDKTVIGAINEVNGNQLDSVRFSSDYKNIILNRKNGLNPYTIPIASIIHNAKLTELNDIDATDIGNGKTLIYDSATQKHKYVDSTGTDELVKMEASTDAKYLSDLIDKSTIINDNGTLKVKKLDGQEVTITEINYLKGLTMNVMDLVNMFSNGGVKIINTPVSTYADLLAYDKSSLIDGISYLVYVLADETHDNAKTTYLIDKTSSTPTYFGFAGEHRDFTTNPIDLANEVTGKLGTSHIDVDNLWSLLTINDTYKTLTTKDEVFGTHGAKALYDELVAYIGDKANSSDLTTHTNDTDIHITSSERTKWDEVSNKVDKASIVTSIDSSSTDEQVVGAKAVYDNSLTKGIGEGNTVIPDGSDLNDYLTPGVYTCFSSVSAETLLNCPHKESNFKLFVNKNTGETTGFYGYQMIVGSKFSIMLKPCVYYRSVLGDKSNPTYSKWQRLCSTSVADVPVTDIVPADTTTFANFAGNCNYCVKNGICYVTIWGVKITSTGASKQAGVYLPKSANGRVGAIMAGVGDGMCHAFAYVLEDGNLFFDVKDANINLYASFSYPVSES